MCYSVVLAGTPIPLSVTVGNRGTRVRINFNQAEGEDEYKREVDVSDRTR
jgi:hypothetical protein